jgi:hypothetical protein
MLPDESQEMSSPGAPVFADSAYRVLQGAFQIGDRPPCALVGTQHLLLSLALRTWHIRRVVGSSLPRLRALVAEGIEDPVGSLGVDDSVGPASVIGEVDATLREAQWQVLGFERNRTHWPYWTPALRGALVRALLDAQVRGVDRVAAIDFIPGMVSDPDNGANRVLNQLGVRKSALLDIPSQEVAREGSDRRVPIAETLRQCGVVSSGEQSESASLLARIICRTASWAAEAGPALLELELEAVRQAIRLGHDQVDTGHLLLAVLELDRQLSLAGLSFGGPEVKNNSGGMVLCRFGVTLDDTLLRMTVPRDWSAVAAPRRRRQLRTKQKHPEWTTAAADAADACRLLAKQRGDEAGSLHLLVSVLQAPSPATDAIVRRPGVEPTVLFEEAQRLLRSG